MFNRSLAEEDEFGKKIAFGFCKKVWYKVKSNIKFGSNVLLFINNFNVLLFEWLVSFLLCYYVHFESVS